MGLLDFLRKKHEGNDDVLRKHSSLPEIREEDFIDKSEPSESINFNNSDNPDIPISAYPINAIYSFLRDDYKTKAYQDALTSPDKKFKDVNISIIRSELELKFKQTSLKYDDMMSELDFHIKSRGDAGLTDLVELLNSKKETYQKHMEEIVKMKSDLEKEEPYMMGIFNSYEVGFVRGLASISLHNLKIDNTL